MIVFLVVVSFLLDGIVSNMISLNGIFYPLFSLVSLIALYPYFKIESYYKTAFFLGLSYDLIYTNTLIFYAFLFLVLSFIISKLYILINDSNIGLVFITILSVTIFRTVLYLSIFLTGNIKFNFDILFKSIYSSLILNIIYVIVLSTTVYLLNKKYHFKRGLRY